MSVSLVEHPVVSVQVHALYAPLLERLACSAEVDPHQSALVDEAGEVWSRPEFDTVLSASRLGFTSFDYQLATMQTVPRRIRGLAHRALVIHSGWVDRPVPRGNWPVRCALGTCCC